jgi:hypothetical protein
MLIGLFQTALGAKFCRPEPAFSLVLMKTLPVFQCKLAFPKAPEKLKTGLVNRGGRN